MDNSENRALNLMIRLKDREKAKKYATNIVSSIFKYKHYKENNPNKNDSINSKMYLQYLINLIKLLILIIIITFLLLIFVFLYNGHINLF